MPEQRAKWVGQARAAILFEGADWVGPNVREGWPAWRRAIRPVGVAAVWATGISQLLALVLNHEVKWRTLWADGGLFAVGPIVLYACVMIELVAAGLHWRHARKAIAPR